MFVTTCFLSAWVAVAAFTGCEAETIVNQVNKSWLWIILYKMKWKSHSISHTYLGILWAQPLQLRHRKLGYALLSESDRKRRAHTSCITGSCSDKYLHRRGSAVAGGWDPLGAGDLPCQESALCGRTGRSCLRLARTCLKPLLSSLCSTASPPMKASPASVQDPWGPCAACRRPVAVSSLIQAAFHLAPLGICPLILVFNLGLIQPLPKDHLLMCFNLAGWID